MHAYRLFLSVTVLAIAAAIVPPLATAQSASAGSGQAASPLIVEGASPAPSTVSVGERAATSADARAVQSPLVREARDTRPLDLQPDLKASPALRLPLGPRLAEAGPTRDSRAAPAIDDSVARCLAIDRRDSRRACLIGGPS